MSYTDKIVLVKDGCFTLVEMADYTLDGAHTNLTTAVDEALWKQGEKGLYREKFTDGMLLGEATLSDDGRVESLTLRDF